MSKKKMELCCSVVRLESDVVVEGCEYLIFLHCHRAQGPPHFPFKPEGKRRRREIGGGKWGARAG